ncbi:HAD-IA family hydrolase [Algicola sagamiensis]|uniref:HAD-IA family hydrolase n=1 Tax=Algicola sagamiensis TaxID=163869 RepID=UPI000363A840|nr:HAD-IA family hydrolase [Algicola sagamiensis]
MRLYKRFDLCRLQVISFDLDDTLYDNVPVILNAESAQLAFLQRKVPRLQNDDRDSWIAQRFDFAKENQMLCQDVSQLRLIATTEKLKKLGIPVEEAQALSKASFDVFLAARNQIDIPTAHLDTLNQLKAHYRLIAVTNGNADIKAIGLGEFFESSLSPTLNEVNMKPAPDLLHLAAESCGVPADAILHVGDSLYSDVGAANASGAIGCWLNPQRSRLSNQAALPHLEITKLSELLALGSSLKGVL